MKFEKIKKKQKVDINNRIYIPKVVREVVEMEEGDAVEVLANKENKAVLVKLV